MSDLNNMVTMPPLQGQNGSTNEAASTEGVVAEDSQVEFSTVRTHLQSMVNDWEHFREKAKENRKTRDVEVSVEVMRREGSLDEDETLVPVRVIDTNITRDLPPYVNYVKNSRRLSIFTCLSNPDLKTDKLELEFTRGMTYPSWEVPIFKLLDGAATHGWDATEVVFDSSKPCNVSVEHIGFDKLFWPRSCKDIQQAKRIIREYDYTLIELRKFCKQYGWEAAQVNNIINARKSGKKDAETNKIYKTLFKEDGVVMCAWFSLEDGCSDWLKKPAQHYIGIDEQQPNPMTGQPIWTPKPVVEYPIEILPYRESEKPKLVDKKGRVYLDAPKQEATTGILSSYLNGLSRATRVFASPKQDDGTGNSVRALENTEMQGGTIMDKPLDFFNIPYPDPQTLKALQWLDTSNSQETNQTNFAVMNREDSRKTAKEMSLAEQQGNMLNSVQLTLFSTYMRKTYGLCWLVVQSQALQGEIKFLLVNQPKPQMSMTAPNQPLMNQQTGQPMMQDNWVNDIQTLSQDYDVRAAGDVDVVQKEERKQQMKQDWPVVQQTGLATAFLSDYIRLAYPDKGDQYAQILQQSVDNEVKTLSALAAGFSRVLEAMVKNHPELIKSLPPDDQARLGQMLQQGEQIAKQQEAQVKK